ncbi:MAG: 2-hydroxyacid dehydrogenase [Casimicrobiaceae bacterium]
MPKADILITAQLPPLLSVPLQRDYRCVDYVKSADKPALLAAEGASIRGLVQGGGTVQTTELLDALPNLEIISVFGVGYDGVPVDYCKKRGIKVTNTPDVLTEDVADTAVALLLMCARGFVIANRLLHKGDWSTGSGTLTTKVAGKRAGIFGLGRIGKAIARRLVALEMQIAYTGRTRQDVPYAFVPDLSALAAQSDFLVIAAPGGPATRNIVDADVLNALGSNGTLINIARGSLVDEPALIAALKAGTVRAAGLDVFANEPNVPPELLAMDNVVLLPHVGSATGETRQAMGDLCRANLDSWFAGDGVKTLIPELR